MLQIKFHDPNTESLFQDISKDIFPEEYGGCCGTVEQIKHYWIKRMETKRLVEALQQTKLNERHRICYTVSQSVTQTKN